MHLTWLMSWLAAQSQGAPSAIVSSILTASMVAGLPFGFFLCADCQRRSSGTEVELMCVIVRIEMWV